ncbi:hypothetical protein [Streptomyces durocortorensis]|uniref:Uncharacterized protein n=1 Tax=Streptomyces durocortorensis TaxID=2811104 RepID=A0ABS2HWQ8_9ACTN|nr:hypothetical protein [Streptomyces durocortorensis]MBM7055459.1 hypothetical protein [Streptomyces durocortorensis]
MDISPSGAGGVLVSAAPLSSVFGESAGWRSVFLVNVPVVGSASRARLGSQDGKAARAWTALISGSASDHRGGGQTADSSRELTWLDGQGIESSELQGLFDGVSRGDLPRADMGNP